MDIGIVGGGVVGKATARCFMEWANVRVYDTNSTRASHTMQEALESDLVFVCLPTPKKTVHHYERMDTRHLDKFFISHPVPNQGKYVIRSTVPVGYTEHIRKVGYPNVVHNPEFLTARCANTDAMLPARQIIGGTLNEASLELTRLYSRRFSGVPIFHVSSNTSEMAKLACNAFFATKISFFNEMHCAAAQLEVNWQQLLECMLSDGRISHSHTQVPGPDGKYGFGGECLPKDLVTLIHSIEVTGHDPSLLKAVLYRNGGDRIR